jgi:hypothetical protein
MNQMIKKSARLADMSEHGLSTTHRAEAGRLASEIHQQAGQQTGGNLNVGDVIGLALLHAVLAVADELHQLLAKDSTSHTSQDNGA